MTRQDVHRPSVLNTNDYEFVAHEFLKVEDLGDAMFLQGEREKIQRHMAQTGGTYSGHEHGGNCMVCGSVNAVYTILFYHRPTNTYVRMGSDCAQKCEIGDFGAEAFRRKVEDARLAVAGKRKAQALLAENNLTALWTLYTSEYKPEFRYEENTIRDIVGRLVQYGSISEAQWGFLRKLADRIQNRSTLEAQKAAERESAADCPTGRIVIEGTVLSTRVDDTPYGPAHKMLVKHDTGYKVWGTIPTAINDGEVKGKRVRFTATVKPSDNDPKFGFYSRPTNAAVVSALEVA